MQLLRRVTSCAPRSIAAAALSTSGKGRIGEKKQLGDEKDFASKRDAELLRNLAAKMATPSSSSSAGGGTAAAAAAASLTAASVPFGAPILPFHHAFPVHSLAEARAFYRDMLGCEEGRSSKTWIVRAPPQRGGGSPKTFPAHVRPSPP
jgi:hypothetical protein